MNAQQQLRLAKLLAGMPTRVSTPVSRMMDDQPGLRHLASGLRYGGPKSVSDIHASGPKKLLSRIPLPVKREDPEWAQVHTQARDAVAKQVRFHRGLARGEERRTFNYPDPNPTGPFPKIKPIRRIQL